jgi:hypothetical protein
MFYIAYIICEFILLNEIHKQLCVTVSSSAKSVIPFFELLRNMSVFPSHNSKCEVHRGQHQWNVYTVDLSLLTESNLQNTYYQYILHLVS